MAARSPLVVNTHDLERRPGTMRTLERTVPAPAEMGTAVIGVPEGQDIVLDLRLEAVMDGILVTGTATAELAGECVRCLTPVSEPLRVDLSELYLYPGGRRVAEREGDEEAEELPELDGELLDLEPTVRDAVVLALPFQPVCTPDCPGLCAECGVRLAEAEAGHHHEQVDPRWSALAGLLPDPDAPAGQADRDDDAAVGTAADDPAGDVEPR